MISKSAWPSGYLAGTGISLIGILILWFMSRPDPSGTALVGTTTGVILSIALVYLAYWLLDSRLQDDHVWAVARWAAIGLAIPILPIAAAVGFGLDIGRHVESSLLVNVAAASAVIGALFGTVTTLEDEQGRMLALHRRNAMLNRVLRHDVLNDAAALLIFAQRLEDGADTAAAELADSIRAKSEEIVELGRTAKCIEELDQGTERRPTDVVDVIEGQVETVRRTRPSVDIETELPDEAWVAADDLLVTVIDNLVENAIQHNDRQPKLRISVVDSPATHGRVEVCVADNGPGLPPATARMLSGQVTMDPADATHDIGLGIWLVKWFVEAYDGEITVEDRAPRGTVVRLSLPAARSVPAA